MLIIKAILCIFNFIPLIPLIIQNFLLFFQFYLLLTKKKPMDSISSLGFINIFRKNLLFSVIPYPFYMISWIQHSIHLVSLG